MSISDFAARLSHTPVPWWMARAASWALAGYALVTGLDLLHPPPVTGRTLLIVEKVASLHSWGVWYLICGGVLTAGLFGGRHIVVWLGHIACAGLHIGFALATLQAVWNYQHEPELVAVNGWLWRAPYVAFLIAFGHGTLAYLRGPVPRRGDEA
jgi:hypothetical protein